MPKGRQRKGYSEGMARMRYAGPDALVQRLLRRYPVSTWANPLFVGSWLTGRCKKTGASVCSVKSMMTSDLQPLRTIPEDIINRVLVRYCLVSVPCVSKCNFLPITIALLYTCPPPAYGVLSSERCPAVIHEYLIDFWCCSLPTTSSDMFMLNPFEIWQPKAFNRYQAPAVRPGAKAS